MRPLRFCTQPQCLQAVLGAFRRFFMNGNRRTYGRTNPLLEMRGPCISEKSVFHFNHLTVCSYTFLSGAITHRVEFLSCARVIRLKPDPEFTRSFITGVI